MLTRVWCLLLQVAHSPVSEVVFHLAWDQVITDLRLRDLLSDAEAGSLKYTHLSWGRNRETAWLLLPRYYLSCSPDCSSATHSSKARLPQVLNIGSSYAHYTLSDCDCE